MSAANELERYTEAQLRAHPGAYVLRSQEPMRRTKGGRYIPQGDGPCDFLAILNGDAAYVIECKSTAAKRWELRKLEPHQAAELDEAERKGVHGCVVLRFLEVPQPRTFVIAWRSLRPLWMAAHGAQKLLRGAASLTPEHAARIGVEHRSVSLVADVLSACASAQRRAA